VGNQSSRLNPAIEVSLAFSKGRELNMRLIRVAGPVVLLAAIVFAGVGGPGKNALAGSPVVSFDICLQDESNGNVLQFNSVTGDYVFCGGGLTLSGTGVIRSRGCLVTLEVTSPDRKLLARTDTCLKTGIATLRLFTPDRVFGILDKNTTNNTCACGIDT